MTWSSLALDRPVWPRRSTGLRKGLTTVLLERSGPGGQAGRSMRIENYLGFPTGISGAELAERAVVQANKFGARLPVGTQVTSLTFENMYSVVHLERGERITAKCLLIATGADYRMLDVEGCSRLEGCGVYYAATPNEALMCRGSDVVVVGGGNSAGQAAVYLGPAGSQSVHGRPKRQPAQEHVKLSGPADREYAPNRGAAQHGSPAAASATSSSRQSRSPTSRLARSGQYRPGRSSASSEQYRAPIGCRERSSGTRRTLSRRGRP